MNKRKIRWIERVILVSLIIVTFIAPSPLAVWQAYQSDKQLTQVEEQKILEPKTEETSNTDVAQNDTITDSESIADNTAIVSKKIMPLSEKTKIAKAQKLQVEKAKKVETGQVIAENYDGVKYDEETKKLTIENPIGEIKEVAFNEQSLPEKTVDVSGNTTTAKYDENGNITEMKDPNGDIIHYNYDQKGRLLSSYVDRNSDSQKLSFWEKLTILDFATADSKDDVTNLSYSETDEIANIENEVGTVTQEFTDDGNLAVSVDASGNLISYDYDELGNIIGKKANAPEVELSMLSSLFVNAADETTQEEAKFAYDEEGNPEIAEIAVSVPEEKTEINPEEETIIDKLVSYIPRVQAKKMTLKKISQDGEFDAQGNRTGLTNQNGEVTAFYFDENDNPVGSATADKEGKLIYEVKYTKDENGYWNTKIDSLGNNEAYIYDEKGQLTKYISNDQETTYLYDERGNIISESTPIGITNYLYDHNKLTRIDNPDGSTSEFSYDQNGNLMEKTICQNAEICQTTIYTYTTNNYLQSVTMPEGKTVFYTYDGLNRRVSKTIGDITTTYLWEGNNLTAELDQNKNVQRQFVYDNENNLLSVIKNGIVYNLIKDSHGSTVAITDENSQITKRYTYDAWGNSIETLKNEISPFLYSGYYFDEDIDAYIMGPRFYDPSYKRFFQKDPAPADLNDELTLNEYIYCENNPVNNYDPDGHKSKSKNDGKSDKAAKEKAEKAKKEAEKREQEQKKKEAEAKKKQQKETEEQAKKAKEAAEKEKKKAQELAEKKAKEAKEKAEKERKQKEEAQKKAKDAAEKAQKEQAEKEKKQKEEAQRKAREAKEKAEKAKAEAERKAKKDQEKKAKELKETKEKAKKAKKAAQEQAEKVRVKAKKEADQKAEKAKAEAKKKQTALTKSYSEEKDIKKSVEKKLREAQKKKKKVEDLLVLKELYYYQREYQKVSGQKQSLSVNGSNSKVAGVATTKSLSSIISDGGTKDSFKPDTVDVGKSTDQYYSIQDDKGNTFSIAKTIIGFFNKEKLLMLTSIAVSLIPIVGEGYDVTTLLKGQDPITKEKLNTFTKVLTVAGLVSGAGSGAAARKIGTEALEKLAKELGTNLDEIIPIATEVAKKYNVNSIEELSGLKDKLNLDYFLKEVREVAGAKSIASIAKKYNWGDWTTLERHFSDHGNDFGAKSSTDYAEKAQEWIKKAKSDKNIDKFYEERTGKTKFYDIKNNIFGVQNKDGGIVTYYKPDPRVHRENSNLEYWEKRVKGGVSE